MVLKIISIWQFVSPLQRDLNCQAKGLWQSIPDLPVESDPSLGQQEPPC